MQTTNLFVELLLIGFGAAVWMLQLLGFADIHFSDLTKTFPDQQIFWAGVGIAILYILGILLHPQNQAQKLPIVLTGPKESKAYFEQIDEFIGATLGPKAQALYDIVVDDAVTVAQTLNRKLEDVLAYRKHTGDAYHFNWSLVIEEDFQRPFEPTHENMAETEISYNLDTATLAANLRRIFSGIVAGNVKSQGIKAIKEHGPFSITGDNKIMSLMDTLLTSFVNQQRMKLPGSVYTPCYTVVKDN